MTTPEQLRDIARYLMGRVRIHRDREIVFDPPDAGVMAADGLDEEAAKRILAAPWWPEMIADILETPEFTDQDASPEIIQGYARDVIQEYIWKRFPLES